MTNDSLLNPFSVISCRGGEVHIIQSIAVAALLEARRRGETVSVLTTDGNVVIDTASIDRIAEFTAWKSGVERKLQADGRFVCDFGEIHGRGDVCRCMKKAKFPLLPEMFLACIERKKKYEALSPEKKAEYDLQSDNSMKNLIDDGYFSSIETLYARYLSAPRQ